MSKIKDLNGQVFNKLTVIERLENNLASQSVWLCRCDCGNESKVVGTKLRIGATKSCGCVSGREATELTGKVFNKLTVINRAGSNKFKKALWLCQCECGKESTIIGSALIKGTTTSCGCVKKAGQYNVIHGHKRVGNTSKAYSVWSNMKSRCSNPILSQYKNYGGRGITVCERWNNFESFLEDMGEPEGGLQIDRIDNDKGYSKDNCRWTTRSVNTRNSRRHMVYVTIDDETMILTDAIQKYKVVSLQTASSRLYLGWTPEEAVMTPYTRCDNKGYREKRHVINHT